MSTAEQTPIRVMIVDDHAVVRRGIRAYLEVLDDMQVVAEAADGQDALDKLETMAAHRELPDVVLLDLLMPRLDGAAAIARITTRHPGVRAVVLTSFGEMERVHAALASGASGYLLKSVGPAEVAAAIHAAARNEVFLDPAVARRLTQEMVSPPTGLSALTERERAVLALVATGWSNKAIADQLVISERTARTHVSNVLRKLQLSSRTQAALVAVREGLVSDHDGVLAGQRYLVRTRETMPGRSSPTTISRPRVARSRPPSPTTTVASSASVASAIAQSGIRLASERIPAAIPRQCGDSSRSQSPRRWRMVRYTPSRSSASAATPRGMTR